MKTLIKIAALLSLANCVPADLLTKTPAAVSNDSSPDITRKSAPEAEVEAYSPPYKPTAFCVPKYITHLGVKFNLQDICSNAIFVRYGQPEWGCVYQYSHQFTGPQLQSALDALIHDRYGYSVSELETRNADTGAGFSIVTTFIRNYYVPNKTVGISGDCDPSDPEYDINLDN